MKKRVLVLVCVILSIVGLIGIFYAMESPPREEFLEGELLEDGTYRYEDRFGTVIEADWNAGGQ